MDIYKTKQDAAIVAIAAGCTEDVSRYYRDRHTRCKIERNCKMKILFKQIYVDQNFYFKDFFETGGKTIKGTYFCKKISEEKAVGLYFFPDRGKPFELENEFFSSKLELGLNSIPEIVTIDAKKFVSDWNSNPDNFKE